MRVLESTAERYDRGVRMLSAGRIDDVYQQVAAAATAAGAGAAGASATPRPRVLDIGCGTGGVALACVALGADVVGIDRNAGMLEVARARPQAPGAAGHVAWLELGAAEIEDRFPPQSFDAVTACLVFSEMSADEQAFTLRVARSVLVPGGRLVVADEVLPRRSPARWLHRLRRLPVALLAYLLTQTTSRPATGLAERVTACGFVAVEEERRWGGTFAIVRGEAPGAAGRAGAGVVAAGGGVEPAP